MKKSELKKLIKPIVRECIAESLIEDGILSSVVSEVFKGMANVDAIVESKQQPEEPSSTTAPEDSAAKDKMESYRKSLMEEIGKDAYGGVDVFEGTTPIAESSHQQGNPLSGKAPGDPGVDIDQIFGKSNKYKELMKRMSN